MSDLQKPYKISYAIEEGHFSKEDLLAKGHGGCHKIIVHSIILPPDGSRSELIMSNDGTGEEVTDNEMFKSWISMAHMLSKKEGLAEGKRALCKEVFETIQLAILASRFGKETELN